MGTKPHLLRAPQLLEAFPNLGPIVDFCVVDLDRQGQGQVRECWAAIWIERLVLDRTRARCANVGLQFGLSVLFLIGPGPEVHASGAAIRSMRNANAGLSGRGSCVLRHMAAVCCTL